MTISLAFLAPNLVKAAVEGRLPRGIGIERCAIRRQNGADSLRRSDSIRNSFKTNPQTSGRLTVLQLISRRPISHLRVPKKRPPRRGARWGHFHRMLSAALGSGRTYQVTPVTFVPAGCVG
jgi:hypothetical protein